MRYKLLFISLLFSTLTFARPQTREVIIDTICNAPLQEMLKVTKRFCYEFQACPDSLFQWAYLGLEEKSDTMQTSKEGRTVIQLRYKDRVYDPKLKTGDVTIDIYVLGSRWWKDQHLGTKYVLMRPANAQYPLTAQLSATYSGSILQGGKFLFRMEPISPNQTRVHYEFSLTFGRVLSTFISDKMWRNAMEWRFETILENLVECAETGTVTEKVRGPQK